ncbi:MAG: nitrilase-related carbon-nitrogen hydrolase [Anaerotignaceae bacterium]
MKLALIQIEADSAINYKKTEKKMLEMLETAGKNGADFSLLPECTYPGYMAGFNSQNYCEALEENDLLLGKIGSIANKYNMFIAVGISVYHENLLRNAGIVFNQSGEIIHSTYKSNLWHFDHKCFTAGEEFKTFDTPWGKMGMIICADGRIPEISRILALDGAKMIIDLVNFTSSAFNVKDFTNPQYEYYVNVRAFENKVWFAVCSKMGVEDNCVCNLGRSMVVNPNGEYVSQLPTDSEDILYCDVDLTQDYGTPLRRNPQLYEIITQENENLPVLKSMNQPIVPSESQFFTSSVQFKAENLAKYEEKAKRYITMNSYCDGNIIFLPQTRFFAKPQKIYEAVSKYLKAEIVIVVSKESEEGKYALALDKTGVIGVWHKTKEGKNIPYACVSTKYGKIGVIFDDELYIPEIARCYMLMGCHILFVSDSKKRSMDNKFMYTRASENKMYVVRNSVAEEDCTTIVNPDGKVSAVSVKDAEQIICAYTLPLLSATKGVVPGTDVVMGRFGRKYDRLLRL